MLMDVFKTAMDMYISYKFGGLLCGTSAVNVAQLCTADINQHSRAACCVALLLAMGRHCYAGRAIR